MEISVAQLDRAGVQERVLGVLRQVLEELGSRHALEMLTRRGAAAHLERDLGLGSLERVELLLRLDTAFGIHLSDAAFTDSVTTESLVEAVLTQAGAAPNADPRPGSQLERTEIAAPATTPGSKLDAAETLTEVIRHRGQFDAGRTHILLYEGEDAPRAITYGELLEKAEVVAASLKRRGIEPGQTVAIMLPTCAEFFWSFAGVLLAGAIPVPIYPPFRPDKIEEYATRQAAILANAEARFLITFQEAEAVGRLLRPHVPTLRGVLSGAKLAEVGEGADMPAAPPALKVASAARGDDIVFLQYTSGSTGTPKGVTLTHANLLANIRAIVEGVKLGPEDVAVSWLPLYHDMGLIGAWFVPLYCGIPMVVMSPLAFLIRPERWLWAIHKHRGTISPAPNFAYELCARRIADKDLEGLDLSSWRAALNGAEPVRAETLERFEARFAPYGFRREAMLPVYGLAEGTLGVAAPAMGAGPVIDRIARAPYERGGHAIPAAADDATSLQFVSTGQPLPGVELRIVDAEGRALSERVEGRLWFRSPAAMAGYYRNPEATREVLRADGWLDSGDLAYIAEGNLYVTGRVKDIIIKGGHNLTPHEIEEIAGRVPGVRTGCVVAFGIPDAASGSERLVVAAEVRDFSERERITSDITRQVTEMVGMPPDIVELLPPQSIPKTSSGKLRRADARRLYLAGQLGKTRRPVWMQIARLATRGAVLRGGQALGAGLRRAAQVVYGIYALLVIAGVFAAAQVAVLFTRDRRRASRVTRSFSRAILALCGVAVRLENAELLEQLKTSGPWIFTPNHSSFMDVLLNAAYLPLGVRFVAKGEVHAMPVIGSLVRRVGHFAFDRSDPAARVAQAAEVEEALRQGDLVGIYPEGTFVTVPGIRPFQLGAFKAAVATGRPICPVAIRGARAILPDKKILARPGRVTITFGPLIQPQGDSWREAIRLRDATREVLAHNTGEPLASRT